MSQYRTAQGKVLDMSVFTAQHEKVRAVGNMRVNARGDTIDSEGRVVQSVNDKINEFYSETVHNPGSHASIPPAPQSRAVEPQKPKLQADAPAKVVKPAPEELSDIERELEESLEEDVIVEKTKEKQSKK